MDPERAAPVFAVTEYVTDPLPVPDDGLPMVIQLSGVVADHEQPCEVEIVMGPPEPLPAGSVCVAGLIDSAHDPFCVAVKTWSPIVKLPTRTVPTLAAAANVTDPLPLPFAPAVTDSHASLLLAIHPHPACVVTAIVPVTPAGSSVCAIGLMTNWQLAPDCASAMLALFNVM